MPFTDSGLWLPREIPKREKRTPHVSLSLLISICSLVLAATGFWVSESNMYWSQRAYLMTTATHVLSHVDKDKEQSIEVALRNTGSTPAFIDRDALHLYLLDLEEHELPKRLERFDDRSAVIDKGPQGLSTSVQAKGDGKVYTLIAPFFDFHDTAEDKKALFVDLKYRDFLNRTNHIRWGIVVDVSQTGGFIIGDDETVGEYPVTPIDDDVVQQVFGAIDGQPLN
jgi:hypothetical protein